MPQPRVSRTTRPERRISVDRAGSTPLHAQISTQLRSAIESGALPAGSLIENEIDLSAALGVSRPTLQKAIAELVNTGFVTRKPGRGTVVLPRSIQRQMTVGSLYDDLLAAGRAPATHVLDFEEAPTPEPVRDRLQKDPAPLVHIRRLRVADGKPLAILQNWIPAEKVTFTAEDLTQHGLYELLRADGVAPHLVEQQVGARLVYPEETATLEAEPGEPLVTVRRVAFTADAGFLEFGDHAYRADRFRFDTVMVG